MVSKWVITPIYSGYNPFTNYLLTSWDVQVVPGRYPKTKKTPVILKKHNVFGAIISGYSMLKIQGGRTAD